jgi:hypothetical protein
VVLPSTLISYKEIFTSTLMLKQGSPSPLGCEERSKGLPLHLDVKKEKTYYPLNKRKKVQDTNVINIL